MLYLDRAYDQILDLIEQDRINVALPLLCGTLYSLRHDRNSWPDAVNRYQTHQLHQMMQRDPFIRRCLEKPRGYAGDAELIDYMYMRRPPVETDALGGTMFSYTTAFPLSDAVCERKDYAALRLQQATARRQRVLVLACGHLREADGLSADDLALITAVDQDPQSIAELRASHGPAVEVVEANALNFLRGAARSGQQWDLIYTLGLTDYFDNRTMALFHKLLRPCVAPGGSILLANFIHDHLGTGWLEAVMDWHLVYRDEQELAGYARAIDMEPRTWSDQSGTIAYCEMTLPGDGATAR